MEPPRPHANLTLSSALPKAAALSGVKKKIKLLNNLNPISPEIIFARFKSNLTKKKKKGGQEHFFGLLPEMTQQLTN